MRVDYGVLDVPVAEAFPEGHDAGLASREVHRDGALEDVEVPMIQGKPRVRTVAPDEVIEGVP